MATGVRMPSTSGRQPFHPFTSFSVYVTTLLSPRMNFKVSLKWHTLATTRPHPFWSITMHLIFISRRIITEKIPEHVPPCKRDSQYCPAPRLFSLAVSHLLTSSSAVAFTKKKTETAKPGNVRKKQCAFVHSNALDKKFSYLLFKGLITQNLWKVKLTHSKQPFVFISSTEPDRSPVQ